MDWQNLLQGMGYIGSQGGDPAAQKLAGQQPVPAPNPQYKNFKEQRFYETDAKENPDRFLWVDHKTHSDWYDKDTIQKFADAAKKHGVDPYDYVALGISESGLGNQHKSNPARINIDAWDDVLRKKYPQLKDMKNISEHPEWRDISIDFGAQHLKNQTKKYKDKLSAYQAYSGTGKTTKEEAKPGWHTYFGKPLSKTDFWKEKPHGKRILDISSKLRKNTEMVSLLEPKDKKEPIPRAKGGPVDPKWSYVVGENGPEVFVPEEKGTIVPINDDTGALRGKGDLQRNDPEFAPPKRTRSVSPKTKPMYGGDLTGKNEPDPEPYTWIDMAYYP